MASTMLFLIMAIIAAILLLAASITATIGANDINNSKFINSNSNAFTAHQHLVIAAALGWSALAVLIVILIVAATSGVFKHSEVSKDILTKTSPTKSDLIAAYRGEKELESAHTTQIIILIVLIVVGIIALIVGIEGIIAAISINNMRVQDLPAQSAYSESISTAIIGFVAMGIMIVAIITYYGIRSARIDNLEETKEFIDKNEEKFVPTTG